MSRETDRGSALPGEMEPLGICHLCRHKRTSAATCTAFPDGIPKPFLVGEKKHLQTVDGDSGITFVPVAGVTMAEAREHP